jgi:glycosyltransferase involved in cell wall biosynthesis
MGKNKVNKKKMLMNPSSLPFVSICTPTFNRRPFIPYMIKCFEHQDYPKERMEWIIVDDGTDKIGDLVQHIPQVKYFSYDSQMLLGKKRNVMHGKTKGEIIVYMDDDDYYPPERVSHAVNTLLTNPNALCVGSSIMYIYFKHIEKMYQFGPYGDSHSTAGTFAFRRKLLNITSYDDNAALAEERAFLKNYTIPFAQLDPLKTILVFSHEHNTFDKRRLLDPDICQNFTNNTDKTVEQFIPNAELRDFYMNQIEDLLKNYEPGRPCMKPIVIKQIAKIEKDRKKEVAKMQLQGQQQGQQGQGQMQQGQQQRQDMPIIQIQHDNGTSQQFTLDQIMTIVQQQERQINNLTNLLQGKETEIKMLTEALNERNSIV